jgi:HAD superfamily hydrolase (TIGR01509 family)
LWTAAAAGRPFLYFDERITMIRAIFWDNDGVLVDTEKLYFQATRELLLSTGVTLTEALFQRISLSEGRSAFSLAADKGVSQEVIDRLHEARNRRYTELLSEGVRIMEGVEETLAELQGKIVMGIVTSSRREHFETMHQRTGLLSHFNFILTREDFTLSKPDPEPYLRAMEKCGYGPDECLVVEDSPRGLASARAAGIRCLVVPNDLTRGYPFTGSWRVLSTSREVPAEIRQIEALDKCEGLGTPGQ